MTDGVIMLRSYYEAIKTLSKREQNVMYSAIFEYVFDEKEPDLTPKLRTFWTLIKPNLDASARKYSANKSNGIKGGRPLKGTTAEKPKQKTQAKNPPILDKEKDKDKEKEKDIYIYAPAELFSQMTEEEKQQIEELAGDKTEHLMRSIGAWLSAGHETSSMFNTCLTFIRNSPREFKGKPVVADPAAEGWHYEEETEFSTDRDGYEVAKITRYKVFDDGHREVV